MNGYDCDEGEGKDHKESPWTRGKAQWDPHYESPYSITVHHDEPGASSSLPQSVPCVDHSHRS